MAKSLLDRNSPEWKLTEHITALVNAMFGRRLRPSRNLHSAICSAVDHGYSHDELRIVFWVARCLTGDCWLKNALQRDLLPHVALRFKGGTNPSTGKPAVQWLDDMNARIDETNPVMVYHVLKRLPDELREGERELLQRMEVNIEDP